MALRPVYVVCEQKPFKIIEIIWYKEKIIPQQSEWGRLKKTFWWNNEYTL